MATKVLFIGAVLLAMAAAPIFATDYIVGDDSGWKLGVDYAAWARGKHFFVEDRLIFNYMQGAHNVYRVNGTAFQQCDASSQLAVLTSGKDVVTLATPGRKWYLCGVGKHCVAGMKLVITVFTNSSWPWTAPAQPPALPRPLPPAPAQLPALPRPLPPAPAQLPALPRPLPPAPAQSPALPRPLTPAPVPSGWRNY